MSVAARYDKDSLQYMQAGGTPRKRTTRRSTTVPATTTPLAETAIVEKAKTNGKGPKVMVNS